MIDREAEQAWLAELETLTPSVRWRGADRTVVYALFSRSGVRAELETAANERDDLFLATPGDVLSLFCGCSPWSDRTE